MDATRPERIGRYRILGELGRGSMGRVYRAYDPRTDREIAIKVLTDAVELPDEAAAEARGRFLVEGRAAGRLSHPGIVLVYDADVDVESGLPYLALELVAGRSLTEVLRERGPLPWGEAAGLAAAVADALGHAHERGIVHRDVKPANVLITDAGRVKIADFGVAKIADESHTRAGMVLGTPNYMSPEQLRGDPLDGRSDLFALGAMLYEMLTGAPPFHADSLAGITHKVVFVDPRPPTFDRPDLPADLEGTVLRALAKAPTSRFPTAEEMAAALRTAGGGTPERPAPATKETLRLAGSVPPPGETAERPRRFEKRTAIGAGALALIVVGAIVASLWLGDGGAAPVAPGAPNALAPGPGAAEGDREAPSRQGSSTSSSLAVNREGEASLEIQFHNRLRHGTMTVWVDGQKVWSTALSVPRDPIKMVKGDPVRATIPVAAGSRTIEVRIAQASARIDSRGVARAQFESGQKRRLRIVLLPYLPKLGLDWES